MAKSEALTEAALLQVAADFATALQHPAMVFLTGDLGAGKTTFVRGVLTALGHKGTVKSPTFSLVETYEINQRVFHHLDLYRLADPGELEFLGFRDLISDSATLFIEWPERAEGFLPNPTDTIHIDYAEMGRLIHVKCNR